MMIIGITGGIGSGKSVVCNVFRKLGIPVYEADKSVHDLYERYPELVSRIEAEVSADAVDKNKRISRKKLSEIVFADESKLKKLNAIVHPAVKDDFQNWINNHKGYSYLLKEAAILFESGSNEGCDKVISVSAPVDLRIARVRERDHKSKTEIETIISRQMSDEERNSRSDFIIVNDEKQLLLPQILKVHSQLIK